MIYTTYMSNIKNIPNNAIKILITRWKPRKSDFIEKENILWRPNLGPTELTLARFKDGSIDWSEFRKIFLDESFDNKMFLEGMEEIATYAENNDVFLICYEKEDIFCHRSILREILNFNDYKCIEYRKVNENINGE